jgi:hypothetical protein
MNFKVLERLGEVPRDVTDSLDEALVEEDIAFHNFEPAHAARPDGRVADEYLQVFRHASS